MPTEGPHGEGRQTTDVPGALVFDAFKSDSEESGQEDHGQEVKSEDSGVGEETHRDQNDVSDDSAWNKRLEEQLASYGSFLRFSSSSKKDQDTQIASISGRYSTTDYPDGNGITLRCSPVNPNDATTGDRGERLIALVQRAKGLCLESVSAGLAINNFELSNGADGRTDFSICLSRKNIGDITLCTVMDSGTGDLKVIIPDHLTKQASNA